MECPKCQTENPEAKRFCRKCGGALFLICPNCGSEGLLEDEFCGDCGQKLIEEPVVMTTEPDSNAERKQITALFSDLSGYTAMTERLDPEDVKEIMGRIFRETEQVVVKYDGFIEKFLGDGVLALFGVPKAHEDDPIRAVRAAREIHELVEVMNPQYESNVGAPLSMHSGINTGLTVTSDVDPEKGTHRVTGDAINVAARLSSLATAGEILVGPNTYRRAEGHFAFEALEPTKVKGKAEPISIYKVLSVKEEPTKVHRPSGLRADLIGRKAELAQLQEAVERLKDGKGSVISICGDAGTGKSRLVEEFKSSLDLSKIRWREGHSYPYSQNIPYFALMDLMNRAWRIEEGDAPDKIREKIEAGVERLLGTRKEVAPYIGSLYSLSYPEIEEVSPEFWKSRLFEGIKATVDALIQYAPTVFCFEDIQWADPSTLDLLRYLLSNLRSPALFICVYRLPFSLFSAHQLNALEGVYEEIRLQDLSSSDTLDMVESLLHSDSIPGELRKFIQKKVEGNPFYVEEAINSLVESGTLARNNGSWELTRPLSQADIPPTVQGVISARLDRLEREMKRILQEASVIGRAFLHEILKRITALQESLDRSLHGLEMLDLVRVRSLQPDLEYIFKHALTQEVVYKGLLRKEREEIHERIGLVMEKLFQNKLSEFCETFAFHFERGRSFLKAVRYLMMSGEKSLKRYAVEESHKYYKRALDLIEEKSDKIENKEKLLIDLLLEWALVFYYRGDFKGATVLFESHEKVVESLADKRTVAMFYAWLGWMLAFREMTQDSFGYLSDALKLGEEMEDYRVVGYTCTWLAWVCADMGLLEEAISYGERAQKISVKLPADQYLYFKSLAGLGHAFWLKGEAGKTVEVGRALLEYGNQHSNIHSIVMGHCYSGFGYLAAGDIPSAIKAGEMALAASVDPLYSQYSRTLLSISFLSLGRLKDAEAMAGEVVKASLALGFEWIARIAEMVLGVVAITEGKMLYGLNTLENVQRILSERGGRCFHAVAQNVLGNLYLQIVLGQGELSFSTMLKNIGFLIKNVPFAAKKAEAHFNKAIEVAEEIGAKGIAGQAYLDMGRLHKAKNRKDKARECIAKAIEYFDLCEAEMFLKQAREELESL